MQLALTEHERELDAFAASALILLVYGLSEFADSGALSQTETEILVWTTVVCVVVSIIAHGFSATPLTKRLRER